MADNSTQGGTDVIRDIDKGGVKTQVFALDLGGSGAESLATGSIPVTGTFFQSTQPVSIAASVAVTGPVTDAQLRATPVPVSGTVAVAGPLTDTQLRATPVPVSGTVSTGLTQPLTDTQLRASAVPVTATLAAETTKVIGTVNVSAGQSIATTGPLTDTQLRASAVPVTATLGAETTKVIGTVNIASAQTLATVTAVTAITNALPAGTNTLGGVKIVPDATSTYAATSADTTALAASIIAKNSAGVLYGISGINNKTSAQYIQVHNTTTVPADTAVPKVVFVVEAGANFQFDTGKFGMVFGTGITVCNSSTLATKTIGAADCWINVLYT